MTFAVSRFFRVLAGYSAVLLGGMAFLAIPDIAQAGSPLVDQSASRATKLTATDRQEIQRIINLQIKAFQRNDETIAFSYAAPATRKLFGNPRAFMEMVRGGYSALYRSESRQFLEAAVIDGTVIQPLRIVTPEGETLVALYSMQRQPDREWRISGCEMAPSTLQVI